MYFERQEPGSQLCAQHCLNNVLQQFTYTEFDLADIAKKLDQAENATLDVAHQLKKSYNYDDTGYFSISVLERALEVWDLSLVRWRGEAMREYQEHPEEQVAFILNLSSHWFPLRRFSTFPPDHTAIKRWYNLNSFLPQPEWISPTYLRLVLTQAEEEGYSVFVVRKGTQGTKEGENAGEGEGWQDGGIGVLPECLADTMAVELGEPVGRSGAMGEAARCESSSSHAGTSTNPDTPTVDFPSSSGAGPSSPPARRKKRQEDLTPSDPIEVEQDEYSRPAATRTRQSSNKSTPRLLPTATHGIEDEDIFENTTFPLDRGDDDEDESIHSEEAEGDEHQGYTGPTDFQFNSRSYDDEDEALQAALKASMNDLPPDWQPPPELPPREGPSPFKAPALAPPLNPTVKEEVKKEDDEDEEILEDDDTPAHEPSPDEIRRRRLAKFGQ
uniref:Ataxin-3 homolog n=1 Tax=Kwoniella dejecticola CBS 10117 TaxID=1296121 RepID=A0A1A5ZZ65_9TREE|nr:ataxin-3 [Kwoniella dejecticola CBS 10117]OBR83099.1 ataxin-3 [Kwoniella dejecticola CBS 10117]